MNKLKQIFIAGTYVSYVMYMLLGAIVVPWFVADLIGGDIALLAGIFMLPVWILGNSALLFTIKFIKESFEEII